MTIRTLITNILAILISASLLTACAPSEPRGPIVFAASSLQKPLEELAQAWQAQGNDPPVLSFASSTTLARQIDNGSLSDLYISADQQWIDYLITAGRLDDGSVLKLASNSLVLALFAEGGTLPDLEYEPTNRQFVTRAKVATGDPETVPLGRFAKEWLQSEGLWEDAQSHIVPAPSSSAAVRLVLLGEVSGGILYASDAASVPNLAIYRKLPPQSHSPILYQAVLLPSSAHPDAAAFLEFLASPEARSTFTKYGFGNP